MPSPTPSLPGQLLLLLITFLLPPAQAISFDYPSFDNRTGHNITYQGDAFAAGCAIVLTKNGTHSAGRAVHSHPVRVWDAATRDLASFTTRFFFAVQSPKAENSLGGHGLAFFLAPNGSGIQALSGGGNLALFNSDTSPVVAVEFDTYTDAWDPGAVHVGIDVGKIESAVYVNWTTFERWDEASVNATIHYDAGTTTLRVFFSDANGPDRSLSCVVDLREVLPEWVSVGFSATTGPSVESHTIHSWSFQSTLEEHSGSDSRRRIGVLAFLLTGMGALAAGSGLAWFILWRRKTGIGWRRKGDKGGSRIDVVIDDAEFDGDRGSKHFPYQELARATKNFAAEGKLGRGGFGHVYKGVLSDPCRMEVAVKRVARDSKQGMKEFISEVKIISRLRHRNLVQLVGWCHERGDLLLVYDYMPNGSLDAHLFGGDGKAAPLPWPTRYSIAQGVAAALLYLHEEWEQCVVHRDVKSSNVMLDASFNAKLGDFGLARLVDHGRTLQTTLLAGTMGYLAPECATTGKAGKESDVYSFGVVALEIACGRRPVVLAAEKGQVTLVDRVWDLYGKNSVVEAADGRLNSDFDVREIERLMVVGLWCAHPDSRRRPSMRQVVSALSFETAPPILPPQMPVATYGSPEALDMAKTCNSSLPTSVTLAPSTGAGDTTGAALSSSGDHAASAANPPLLLKKQL